MTGEYRTATESGCAADERSSGFENPPSLGDAQPEARVVLNHGVAEDEVEGFVTEERESLALPLMTACPSARPGPSRPTPTRRLAPASEGNSSSGRWSGDAPSSSTRPVTPSDPQRRSNSRKTASFTAAKPGQGDASLRAERAKPRHRTQRP